MIDINSLTHEEKVVMVVAYRLSRLQDTGLIEGSAPVLSKEGTQVAEALITQGFNPTPEEVAHALKALGLKQ